MTESKLASGKQHPADEHPYDTRLSSGLRFLSELFEWTACAWAASRISPILAILALVVLIGLPTVFSTPGDKKQFIIPTPGPFRVLLELAVHAVGVVCAWMVWPVWLAVAVTILVITAIVIGLPRTRWLLRGAPETE